MAASKQTFKTYIHTHIDNAVMLVLGSLRLAPKMCLSSETLNGKAFLDYGNVAQMYTKGHWYVSLVPRPPPFLVCGQYNTLKQKSGKKGVSQGTLIT